MGIMACGTGARQSVLLSRYANVFGVPVAFLGVGGYLTTVVRSMLCLQPRFMHDRRMSFALVVVSGFGVAFAAYLTYLENVVINAWCRWCVLSASIILGIFASSVVGLRGSNHAQRVASPV